MYIFEAYNVKNLLKLRFSAFGSVEKTISHGRKLLGAYSKAYFAWKIECQLSKTLKLENIIFSNIAGNHLKRCALMR